MTNYSTYKKVNSFTKYAVSYYVSEYLKLHIFSKMWHLNDTLLSFIPNNTISKHLFTFFSNYEAPASELLKNGEQTFPCTTWTVML